MERPVMLSEARKQLFDLFKQVTAAEGRKVVIGHRDSAKLVVLVSKEHLDQLEVRGQHEVGLSGQAAFALFGSATLNIAAEDVLRASRREDGALSRQKRRRLGAASGGRS